MNEFGPGLSPEEQKRRLEIVTRIGMVMLAALTAFVVFVAFGGLRAF